MVIYIRKALIGLMAKHVQLTPQVKEILLTDECLLTDPVVDEHAIEGFKLGFIELGCD